MTDDRQDLFSPRAANFEEPYVVVDVARVEKVQESPQTNIRPLRVGPGTEARPASDEEAAPEGARIGLPVESVPDKA